MAISVDLNADFSQRVVIASEAQPWEPSPMAGVFRRKLDRIGDEVARATSIVRYDAGLSFSEHVHGGGEEFLVLDGVFSDKFGDYGVGTWIRSLHFSQHEPFSKQGCLI